MNEDLRRYYLQQMGIEPLVATGDVTKPLNGLSVIGEGLDEQERLFLASVGKTMGVDINILPKMNPSIIRAIIDASHSSLVIHLAKEPETGLSADKRYIHLNEPLKDKLNQASFKKQLYLRLI